MSHLSHADESDYDPSEAMLLHSIQLHSGAIVTPDQTQETWEWHPSWRYIKRVNAQGQTIGVFSSHVVFGFEFNVPMPPTRYMEW